MICDDCDIETGNEGNHATDAECMAALILERGRYKMELEAALAEKRGSPPNDEVLYKLFDEIKAKAKVAWSESQKGRRDFPKMIHDGLNVVVESVFREAIKALYPKETPDDKA